MGLDTTPQARVASGDGRREYGLAQDRASFLLHGVAVAGGLQSQLGLGGVVASYWRLSVRWAKSMAAGRPGLDVLSLRSSR